MIYLSKFLFFAGISFFVAVRGMEREPEKFSAFGREKKRAEMPAFDTIFPRKDQITIRLEHNVDVASLCQITDGDVIEEFAQNLGLETLCSDKGSAFIAELDASDNKLLRQKIEARIDVLCATYDCYESNQFLKSELCNKFEKLKHWYDKTLQDTFYVIEPRTETDSAQEPEQKQEPGRHDHDTAQVIERSEAIVLEQETEQKQESAMHISKELQAAQASAETNSRVKKSAIKNRSVTSSKNFLKWGFLSLLVSGSIYYFGYHKNIVRHRPV